MTEVQQLLGAIKLEPRGLGARRLNDLKAAMRAQQPTLKVTARPPRNRKEKEKEGEEESEVDGKKQKGKRKFITDIGRQPMILQRKHTAGNIDAQNFNVKLPSIDVR